MTKMVSAAAITAAMGAACQPVRGMIGAPRADANDPKALLAQLNQAFAEFKEANDKRIKEIEAKGAADPLLEQKVDTINAAIDQVKADLDRIAKEAARASVHGGRSKEERDWKNEALRFLSAKEGKPLQNVTEDQVNAYKAYAAAVTAMIRRGGAGGDQLPPDVRAAMSVGQDSEGGFLVPIQIAQAIQTRQFETSDVRAIASVMTIGTDKLVIPLDVEEAASGGWVGEKASRADTNTPGVGEQTIEVFEQYALSLIHI